MSLALPLGLVWVGAAVTALLDGRRRAVGWAAVGVLGAGFVALCVLLALVLAEGPRTVVAGDWPSGVGIALRADALGVVFAVLSMGVLLAGLAYEVVAGMASRKTPALVLFMGAGLTGLFLTADIFNFYVFFELSMVAAYAVSTYGGERHQVGAGFIFAVVNLLGTFLFLIGLAAVYAVTGTLDMDGVGAVLAQARPTAVALIGVSILVAFSIKLGLFPFHFWLPAVYVGVTPGVAAILSGALANIGSYGLLRFGGDLLPDLFAAGSTVLLVLGSASIVYGAVQAISRRSTSEVLAYSAIGQVGYVLIALGVGGPVGYAAAVLYAIVNALNKALLFLTARVRGWLVGACFAVGAFSVAGVPPSAGFFGKVELFRAGIEARSAVLVGLIFLGGALSFVYMFQIYQRDFWREARHHLGGRALQLPGVLLALVVLGLGLWPEPLLAVSREAAGALRGGGG
ncbi:MAG TPA: proton-conducting transporter membrane subunit [Solirubrobacteraceae bacterium]|nr:proton-conducting transporter membrane subunit [Solirubrobacteraceae bacterium]